MIFLSKTFRNKPLSKFSFSSKNSDLYSYSFHLFHAELSCLNLCNEFVWNWSEENRLGWIGDDASWQWLFRFTFQDDTFAFSESIATLLIVGLDAGQEFVTALRWLDVFDADIDALGENLASDALVHDNSECVRRDVVNASSFSVVSLEWHAFVDCSVTLKR